MLSRTLIVGLTALSAAAGFGTLPVAAKPLKERPLTITRHTGPQRGTGIEYRDGGREIVAWGGFSANGYGYGLGNHIGAQAARREARNEAVRLRTGGIYGYGFDGLGGTFGDDDESDAPGFGYNNPNYGNAFSSYTGYGGVPTNLAFGPAFANRYITDSDAFASDADIPGPSPAEMGYRTARSPFDPD